MLVDAAALVGVMILGPVLEDLDDGSPPKYGTFAASNLLVTLGTFILWMGWYGFNGGRNYFGFFEDVTAMSRIFTIHN